jgi:hypothetical protein
LKFANRIVRIDKVLLAEGGSGSTAIRKGKRMLLRQLYELKHCNLVDGPLTWREALLEGISRGISWMEQLHTDTLGDKVQDTRYAW